MPHLSPGTPAVEGAPQCLLGRTSAGFGGHFIWWQLELRQDELPQGPCEDREGPCPANGTRDAGLSQCEGFWCSSPVSTLLTRPSVRPPTLHAVFKHLAFGPGFVETRIQRTPFLLPGCHSGKETDCEQDETAVGRAHQERLAVVSAVELSP